MSVADWVVMALVASLLTLELPGYSFVTHHPPIRLPGDCAGGEPHSPGGAHRPAGYCRSTCRPTCPSPICTATCCRASTTGPRRWPRPSTTPRRRRPRAPRRSSPRRTSRSSTSPSCPTASAPCAARSPRRASRSRSAAAVSSKPYSIPGLSDADLEVIAHGPPGARWLLYEVPFHGADEEFVAGARELRARGFGLLLAHPERSRGIVDAGGLAVIEGLLADRAVVAANTGPLIGREGAERRRAAELLLRRCVPTVVATDAHAPVRPYTLAMAAEAVARVTGREDVARRLAAEAPARLLADGIVAGRRAA